MTTTPQEFLQFAKDMGLDYQKSLLQTSSSSVSNDGYSLTGLSVLNNLCHLIEQIHSLKAENNHLRAHLDLVNHVEKFLYKNGGDSKLNHQNNKKYLHSAIPIHHGDGIGDEEKSFTLSPSNSLKIKKRGSPTLSISSRERQGTDFLNTHEDSPSLTHVDHDQPEATETTPNWNNWNKLRHALSFSRRRKHRSPMSPILPHTERTIPAISISFESDDDRLNDPKHRRKKTQPIRTANNNRRELNNDDSEDEELVEFRRQGISPASTSSYLPISSTMMDDDNSFSRKPSKIAHYRHKLYSKLHTVKKQFSDQNSMLRPLTSAHSSTFDDIGSGLNHALLSSQLASAMTKSYQQKMREWQSLQKSNFLVNYRRQSIINKNDINNFSRKPSVASLVNDPHVPAIEISNAEMENNVVPLSPILSPNQRSLILHQWREIMCEEICLREYHEYLERKMQELKELEENLKSLKTNIFCTTKQKLTLKHRSMSSIEQLDQDILDQNRRTDLPQRCRSLQSLVTVPASWILAVQSAAYSDILDGTSKRTTERAIIFNKNFFNQLKHFKDERQHFQQDTLKKFQELRHSNSPDEHSKSNRARTKVILTRACLRKFSYTSTNEFPQSFLSNPMIPLQTTISKLETSSFIDLLSSPTNHEQDANFSSTTTLNKRSKRARFDFKRTLQRSKSMCMTQFNSWFQRRRQQHLSESRRKSAVDPKTNKDSKISPCSTPKFLGSPRLARIHQRIFKQHPSPVEPLIESPSFSSPLLDDSDEQFQKIEHPVRIYLPARNSPSTRHVRITDATSVVENNNNNNNNNNATPPMSKIASPILQRRNFTSALKTTARERRESFAAQSKSS
ncbi:unnamed protein product [Adineta ricciae]|uniref:Uncharacterized protein n=1 Tax=Adineta ricciae TaxID=249248 RepID=A0A813QLH7_ADIRI|nr:unnamed protein product [Adineta ricciae]